MEFGDFRSPNDATSQPQSQPQQQVRAKVAHSLQQVPAIIEKSFPRRYADISPTQMRWVTTKPLILLTSQGLSWLIACCVAERWRSGWSSVGKVWAEGTRRSAHASTSTCVAGGRCSAQSSSTHRWVFSLHSTCTFSLATGWRLVILYACVLAAEMIIFRSSFVHECIVSSWMYSSLIQNTKARPPLARFSRVCVKHKVDRVYYKWNHLL